MVQRASFDDFLGFLAISILIFAGISWLFRLFFPFVIRYFLQKALTRMEKKYENFKGKETENQQDNSYQQPKTSPKEKKIVGEYIDYEELD